MKLGESIEKKVWGSNSDLIIRLESSTFRQIKKNRWEIQTLYNKLYEMTLNIKMGIDSQLNK